MGISRTFFKFEVCSKVDVGEFSALLLVAALMCKVGVEFFRTLRVVDDEVLADADIRRVEDVWVVVAEVWVIELIVGPAGPCNTCIGCGGGDNGQLREDRLMVGDVIGGGEVGISIIGLDERVGLKSDWPLERNIPLRTGHGAC